MAKTSYVDIPVGDVDAFYSNVQAGDRFTYSRIRKKSVLLSDAKKLDLAGRSLLSVVGPMYKNLDSAVKLAWKNAGAVIGMKAYNLFVQDQCARIKAGLAGEATPSLLHQSFVGQLHIESPATELKIAQFHPDHYFVKQKVPGFKNMYSPVMITESLALPLSIGLNYKSNLTAQGAGAFAKFYAYIHYLYQGRDLYYTLSVNLDLLADWNRVSAVLNTIITRAVHYDLYIHLFNVSGDLFFDNVSAEHSGVNWCRDPFCKDINQGFTSAFYQVPKHWTGVIAPAGTEFESVYKDF
ncbi:MAG: hypothetical protein WC310_05445 [Patescibacteria group bacterium]|jgi:hypothetical protein